MPIDCGDIEALAQTFLDGELSEEDAASVVEHTESCESCKQRMAAETRLHRALQRALIPPHAPASLRDRISLALDREDFAQRRSSRARWGWVLPGAASLAAAAALVLFVASNRGDGPERTVDDAVMRHIQRAPIEVRGAAVQEFATRNLPEPVQLPRFNTPTTILRGARLSHLDGRDALQLYYDTTLRNRSYVISALIVDASHLDFRTRERHVIGGRELWVGDSHGYNVVAHRDERGIGYFFISDMSADDLLGVVTSSDLMLGDIDRLPAPR